MLQFYLNVNEFDVLPSSGVELVFSVSSLMQFDSVNVLLKAQMREILLEDRRDSLHPVEDHFIVSTLAPDKVKDSKHNHQRVGYLKAVLFSVILSFFLCSHLSSRIRLLEFLNVLRYG